MYWLLMYYVIDLLLNYLKKYFINHIQEHDANTILSMTFRVLQTKRGMEKLEADDAIFDLYRLKRRSYCKRKSKSGRHDQPKNESVQKAIEIGSI